MPGCAALGLAANFAASVAAAVAAAADAGVDAAAAAADLDPAALNSPSSVTSALDVPAVLVSSSTTSVAAEGDVAI
jgi:hypothetical protein